jgi:hypothetical protein
MKRRSLYRRAAAPGHPRASKGQVLEHILVVERALGRSLPPKAVIHHVDENSRNNVNGNLVVLQNQTEHRELHTKLRVLRAGADPWRQRLCTKCKRAKSFDQFYAGIGRRFPSSCKDCSKARLGDYTRRKREAAKAEGRVA